MANCVTLSANFHLWYLVAIPALTVSVVLIIINDKAVADDRFEMTFRDTAPSSLYSHQYTEITVQSHR